MRQFFSEVRRRHVYRIAVAYAVVAWLLIQIATQVFPFFEIPNWGVRLTILLIVIGFPVAIILAWAFEITPEGIKRTDDPGFDERTGRRIGRKFIAFVAVVTLLAAGFALFQFARWKAAMPAIVPSGSGPAVVAKAMAVLPFKPLAAENRDLVLELGMADSLIAKLSNSREMIVRSLTSVRKYIGIEQDPLLAGRELGVNTVLEGSVQRSGDYIKVTARLIAVADGGSLWAGTFNEKFTNVFEVQDAIAQKVATALALHLSREEQKRLTKRYTESPEAYQLYLQGRFYWNKWTEEGWRKSIEYFKEALTKDPNYALAYSGLADAFSIMADFGYGVPKENFEQARTYAEKALSLDDSLADAHLSLGIVKLLWDWDAAGAQKELERAKELNSNNAQIYHFYGHCLELQGRFDEAIAETKRGLELDPTNLVINSELGLAYYWARRFDQAIAQHRKTLEMDPAFVYAALCLGTDYNESGRYQEALIELNRARPISHDWSQIVAEIGYAHALLGQRADAEKIIGELSARSAHEYIDPTLIAYVYSGLGDKDQAFAWMEKAYQDRSGLILWLQIEPHFDKVRSDPRFADLVHRMGLDRK